ncbi:MAG: efflux RND transporter periplasmic adaptor subunit [Gammaproteobacteria bacterium]
MNRFLLLSVTAMLAGLAGFMLNNFLSPGPTSGTAPDTGGEPEILYWVAPMDPNYRRDGPGKSPMGMDLVPVYAEEAAGATVDIDPAVQNSLGVRTEAASVRPLWRKVTATGIVGFDESRIRHVMVRTKGWVVASAIATSGERVAAGDLLFELYAPELVTAQKEFLQATRRGDARLIGGAEDRLRALGMDPSEIAELRRTGRASERVRFVAPQDGVVTELGIREGMYVQPNTLAVSLASLDSVWLLAEAFESQAPWIAEGQAAEARLKYIPDAAFSGEVDYVYPVLDPLTRNLRVRLRFDNPGELLKPNMYAEVTIYGKLRPRALTVPREALIRGPDRDRVAVALGDGRFEVREVLTGLESGSWVEIVAGLREGEPVVTSAQFLIDSEASLAGSIVRLDPGHHREAGEPPVSAVANGWIEDIEPGERRMRIAHGPIDALGWPAMNMMFEVEPQVDLAAFEVGQNIRFQLRQTEAGDFVITIASRTDAKDENLTPSMLDRLEAADSDDADWAASGAVNGYGDIVGVEMENGRLRMRHDPIPALGWPAMTMNFEVTAAVDLEPLAAGQRVRFRLVRDGDAWVIDRIAPLPAGEDAPGHDGMDHGSMDHDGMDHGDMDHDGMGHDAMNRGAGHQAPIEQGSAGHD